MSKNTYQQQPRVTRWHHPKITKSTREEKNAQHEHNAGREREARHPQTAHDRRERILFADKDPVRSKEQRHDQPEHKEQNNEESRLSQQGIDRREQRNNKQQWQDNDDGTNTPENG